MVSAQVTGASLERPQSQDREVVPMTMIKCGATPGVIQDNFGLAGNSYGKPARFSALCISLMYSRCAA